jgi:hypothetical protein
VRVAAQDLLSTSKSESRLQTDEKLSAVCTARKRTRNEPYQRLQLNHMPCVLLNVSKQPLRPDVFSESHAQTCTEH